MFECVLNTPMTSDVFIQQITQPLFTCLKSIMEVPQYCLKFAQTQHIKSDIIAVSDCHLGNLVFFLGDFEQVFTNWR